MKKILFSLLIILLYSTATFAQDNKAGESSRTNGAEMREKIKQRLKNELNLTDTQMDSVETIQRKYQMQSHELIENSSLNLSEKKTKTENINAERRKELKAVLTDEQLAKLDSLIENMRKMREDRQGLEKAD